MKRILCTLGMVCLPVVGSAQQQVMTFDGLPDNASASAFAALYPGFTFRGLMTRNGALFGLGREASGQYIASATPFTVTGVDLRSQASTNNLVVLRGYTLGYISTWNATHPLGWDFFEFVLANAQNNLFPGEPSYFTRFTVDPDTYSSIALDWEGLGALVFDTRGGDPLSPVGPGWPGFAYFADNIAVTVTPEPATAVLLGSGMLMLVGWRRRRA